MVRWRCDDRVAMNIGRILVGKSRAGHTDLRSVTCQMDRLVTIHRPLAKVGLWFTACSLAKYQREEDEFGNHRGKGQLDQIEEKTLHLP